MMEFLKNTGFQHEVKIAVLLFIFPLFLKAQTETISESKEICPPKTILEIFKKSDSALVVKPTKNNFFLVIPAIGSQPATGFFLVPLHNTHSKENKNQINIRLPI